MSDKPTYDPDSTFAQDNVDRQREAFRIWFVDKFSNASLVDIVTILTNIALVVVALVAAWIYGGQLGVMKSQLEQMNKQLPPLQKSADAAGSAANTASDTLKESKRQFGLMFPQVSQQSRTAQETLETQSDPELRIIVESAIATTVQPKTAHPDAGESKRQWEEMKPRKVTVVYAVHNDGYGQATRFAAELNFGEEGMGTPLIMSRAGVCSLALAEFKTASMPLADGSETKPTTIASNLLLDSNATGLRFTGCVVYSGRRDPNKVFSSLIEGWVLVGPNRSDGKALETSVNYRRVFDDRISP